jgi:hypothetical protein
LQNHTDEQDGRIASVVRRGDRLQKANDQSFRFRNDLGLPNQVCLFRQEQNTIRTRLDSKIVTDNRACNDPEPESSRPPTHASNPSYFLQPKISPEKAATPASPHSRAIALGMVRPICPPHGIAFSVISVVRCTYIREDLHPRPSRSLPLDSAPSCFLTRLSLNSRSCRVPHS